MVSELNKKINDEEIKKSIIDYTNWLVGQNLMICESAEGYSFRSSMIGGKKYTPEELYNEYISENK